MTNQSLIPVSLLNDSSEILENARNHIQYSVNSQMVRAYWHIGRLIVEQEQQGNERAQYGKR